MHSTPNTTAERRPRSRTEFQVAILCTLPLEANAIEALFDDHYDEPSQLYGKEEGDANIYKTGRIGTHYVVLVYIPGKGYRNSASVVSSLRLSFSQVKLALLVGTCKGMPFPPSGREIVLGDVIISDFLKEYDFGRLYADRFELEKDPKETLGKQTREIMTLLKSFQTFRRTSQLQKKAAENLLYLQCIEGEGNKWHYPGASQDILYESSYLHKHYWQDSKNPCSMCSSSGSAVCDESLNATCEELGCAGTAIERHRLNGTENPISEFHIGSVASANTVMNSGEHRDSLAENEGVIGFEMEGPGVWDNLPCVIIKGVCDYADSHNSEKWQNYAAATSASYTKAFLEYWTTHKTEDVTLHDPSDMVYVRKSNLAIEQRRRYLESLRFREIENRYADVRAAHFKTCHWLLTHPRYQTWFDLNDFSQPHGMLWIKGNPGSGKSTLVKFAFENTLKHAENNTSVVAIAFFFNGRGGGLETSAIGMYRSFLVQLLEKIPGFQNAFDCVRLTSLCENEIPTWNAESLKRVIRHVVKKLGTYSLICFIDAINECSQDEVWEMVEFLEELGDLAIESQLRFRVFLSSRHYPAIPVEDEIQLTIDDQEGHGKDIANYVNSVLRGGNEITEIKEKVVEKSSNNFLWVCLIVKTLNKDYARGHMHVLQQRLQEIPAGLDEFFESIITRDVENVEELVLCLQLVLFSRQPLNKKELYFALQADTQRKASKERSVQYDSPSVIDRYILNASKGLVEVRNDMDLKFPVVQFIHESVKDFLLTKNWVKPSSIL